MKTRKLLAAGAVVLLMSLGVAGQAFAYTTSSGYAASDFATGAKDDLQNNINPPKTSADVKLRYSELIEAGLLSIQSHLDFNQALYHYDLVLAGLERITAGGVCAGLDPWLCGNP